MTRFTRASGFTLLEVVIAMTIVGLGVVTLLEIFSIGARLGARSSARTEALARGRQVMDEILARRIWRDGTERGGVSGVTRWQLEVRPAAGSAAPFLESDWELKEVTLEMAVSDAGRERIVEFNTLRLLRKDRP